MSKEDDCIFDVLNQHMITEEAAYPTREATLGPVGQNSHDVITV